MHQLMTPENASIGDHESAQIAVKKLIVEGLDAGG